MKGYCIGVMDIFKAHHGDCSNFGISSKFKEVQIWSEEDPEAPENAVVIRQDETRIYAVPANIDKRWSMFGGCFIYTSNGVVPHAGTAIKLHDRFE